MITHYMKPMMMTIKHIYQTNPITCGPSCLYMVFKFISNKQIGAYSDVKYTIEDIATICGTDWEVGTPPDRMEKGMNSLGIKYVEHINHEKPFDFLKDIIDKGNIPILRTITKGAPHWIIVDKYNIYFDGSVLFNILDSWLGEIKYTQKDLNEIWSARDYYFFEILINEN